MRKKLLIAFAILLLLTPLVIVTSLLYSETGLRLAQGQLAGLERYGVRLEGVSGTLAGPLRIARFELIKPNVHIVSHDIVIQLRIRQLFVQSIGVESLTARDTLVEILRSPPQPPPTRPLRFLPSFLRVDVSNARFDALRYVNIDGTIVDAQQLSGSGTLTSGRIRVHTFNTNGSWFNATGAMSLTAQRPLGLELSTQGDVTRNNIVYGLNATLTGTTDQLGIKANLLQPSLASADAVLTRPDNSWRIKGRVTSPEFSLQPWVNDPPFSMRDVALDVEFAPRVIRASGQILVPEVDGQPLLVDASGRYAQRIITIDRADVALAQAPSRLQASGTIGINGAQSLIDAKLNWTHLQWPLRGEAVVESAAGSGSLAGTLPYRFTVDSEVTGPNIPVTRGTAQGVIAKESISLAAFDLQTLGGRVAGDGELQFPLPRAWRLSATATDIDPANIDARFPGRLTARIDGTGRGLDKNAHFKATISQLRGVVREQAMRGRGGVERDARGWRVNDAQLDYGSAKLALNGELHDSVQATWSVQAPSLAELLPDAKGSLNFTGSASGPAKSPHIVLDMRGERVGYQNWRAQRLTVVGDVDLGGQTQSRLSIDAAEIGSASPLIDTLRATVDGTAENHRVALEFVGRPANPSEPTARAQMLIEGRYDDAIWNAQVSSTQIDPGSEQERLTLVQPAKLSVSSDRALLESLCFAMGNGRLCTEGKWQRNGPWDAKVSGYEIPLAALLPPSGPDTEFSGRIEGSVHLFGSPTSSWQGEAGMRIIDAAIIYRPQGAEAETLNLGTGGLSLIANTEQIRFSFGVQAFTDTFLFTNATIARNDSIELMRSPLVGDFRARAADANILPIVFPDIDNAAGLLTANGTLRGTLAGPLIDGRIELADGEFDSYRANLALRNLNLVATLGGNTLDFKGAGRAGDGELQVTGGLSWFEGQSRGSLQLRGENLLVADLAEYRVVASPNLNFEIDGRSIHTTGEVTIPTARVQPADLTGAVQASGDASYVGEHPAEQSGRFVVSSDINVKMGDDVRIDSFGLQGRIVGGVATTVRTGETAFGRGELSVAEGRYEAYGQKLEITRGKLLFEASPLSDPALDIEARRKVETVTVGLNVRGTLQAPRLSFFSDPAMAQTQIVSYLLVGKPAASMQSGDAAAVSSARDALAVQGGGLLASQIGRRIGLEEVGVESTTDSAGETNQQLVLGKFLSPRLFISYGISLTESINTLKLRYTISDRWLLKTEAGENQSADVEFTVER